MQWDAVAYSVRVNEPRRDEIYNELDWLRKCGVFHTDILLVVEDPCEDVGSGGSTLNALLVVAERLCSMKNRSILDEDVILRSKVLIIHSSSHMETLPLGAAFSNMGRLRTVETVENKKNLVLEMPIVHLLQNIALLASYGGTGTWIVGTDAYWDMDPKYLQINRLPNDKISVFTFQGSDELAQQHGTYTLNQDCTVDSLHYRNPPQRSFQPMILAVLYMPASISRALLSLHSVHPLASSTYYGTDNGAVGFKLSLFFEFVQSTCVSESEFLNAPSVEGKCDSHNTLLKTARRLIHARLGRYKTKATFLPMGFYHYFQDSSENWADFAKMKHIQMNCLFRNTRESFIELCLQEIRTILHSESRRSFMEVIRPLARLPNGDIVHILDSLQQECLTLNLELRARMMSLVSSLLAEIAGKEGGVRSGPAANPQFTKAIDMIKNEETDSLGITELFRVVKEWLDSPTRIVRAARHVEAACQIFTQRRVMEICRQFIPEISLRLPGACIESVRCEVAARADLYGGWLDTPPITLDTPNSAVINLAIRVDGKKPLACEFIFSSKHDGIMICINDDCFTMKTAAEIWECHDKPTLPGSLVAACLVAGGLINSPKDDLSERIHYHFGSHTGIEIKCTSQLPHGSGLGTSSILAAALLASLWTATGIVPLDTSEGYEQVAWIPQFNNENLYHTVLYVEQLLTTGGGWQDAVGGVHPGLKITRFINGKKPHLEVESIPMSLEFESEINQRLCMIYTGKTRLAKNVLQEVVRGWHAYEGDAADGINILQSGVQATADELKSGHFLPSRLLEYSRAKQLLASGSLPDSCSKLIELLTEQKVIEGACMAGAGGGGFMYVWLSPGKTGDHIRTLLKSSSQESKWVAQSSEACGRGHRRRKRQFNTVMAKDPHQLGG